MCKEHQGQGKYGGLTDMSEALRLVVTIVICEALVLLGAIIPRQLQEALLQRREPVFRHALGARVAEEIQIKPGSSLLVGAEERHAENLLIELERLFRVLDPDHRVVLKRLAIPRGVRTLRRRSDRERGRGRGDVTNHAISARIRSRALFLGVVGALGAQALRDDLDPVSVRIERKGDMLHASVGELLLELITRILDALACRLDVVDGDTDVSEAAVRLLVAVVDGVGVVGLGAVVMRELDDALAVERAIAARGRRGPVVR